MNKLEQIFERIVSLEEYIRSKKRNYLLIDKEIFLITEYYLYLTRDERILATSLISPDASEYFIGLTPNFSALAIDTGDIRWIKRALILNIFDSFSDYRISMLYLAFVSCALGRRYKNLGAQYMDINPFLDNRDIFTDERVFLLIQSYFKGGDARNFSVSSEKKINGKTCFVDYGRKNPEKQCKQMLEKNSFFEKLAIEYASNESGHT